MADSLRILGIDPGSRKTGYGLIEHSGNRTRYLASGCIKLNLKESLAERLHQLSTELDKLIEEFQPDCGAVEKIFFAKNAQSALTLGHARGVILLKFSERQLVVHEYQTLKVKQTVVGVGRADKNQVQHMVKILLNLQNKLQEDEADALAVAITHAHLWLSQNQLL
ncbi:MAG: crossover junction endodeoxyribonuclease RuvC [SAR324 cluster bacterium]|nr:crossover junction endodeoxyribonuclease RuvC [SAR324 cluster bacterium]MDP6745185.1 crossover junction endodeoxyribonuclease RuvC [SAR324 cluster bacterium]MDP7047420.1 crossover junction endodeoxyribonuclease RuvC [SAR324 cluster bacterium]MEC9384358.1 crossover junction endodeoxyribonuclease RuvC [SAR324 cluster bacterium]MED5403009.1 crossover junction endodeoxyribonuclease RuvC [SAR324 cluster bacterium]